MNELYERLQAIKEKAGNEFIVDSILNYFNSDDCEEFIEYLEEEMDD